MSLFDDASLVLTPNGYKGGSPNGKLYSIKPTSGAGDMTVVRATTATRVNSAGVIQLMAINVPRLDYPPLGGCPKILVEPERINKLFQSQDISSALWIKGNAPTITTNIALAPDGTTTADGIKADDAVNFKIISQTKIVTANSTVTSSVFVKKETSQTNFGGFALFFTGGTTKILRLSVNPVLGIVQAIDGNTLTATTKVEDYGAYWRISATTTDNGSNISLQYVYYATASTNGTNFVQGVGSVRTVWGFQLELAANATSYIPTTIAEITRVADVISKTGISSLIGQTEGTLYAEFNNTLMTYAVTGNVMRIFADASNEVFIRKESGTSTYTARWRANGLNVFTQSAIAVLNGNNKIAIAYKSGDSAVYLNGAPIGTTPKLDTGAFSVAPSQIAIGSNGTIDFFNDRIELATVFQTRLINSQLATLTTL